MSDITNKKLGYSDLQDYIFMPVASEDPSELVKVNTSTGGWRFKGGATDEAYLSIMESEPIYYNQLLSVQILLSLRDIVYADVPYLQIRTKPTGTNDYFPGVAHSEFRYKIRDDQLTISNNELIMFYNSYEPGHLDTTTTRHEEMRLYESFGDDNSNVQILSVRLIAAETTPFDYTILSTSHNSNGIKRRIEVTTFSNLDIGDSLQNIQTSVGVLENRTQYASHRGRSQIFLGSTTSTALLADSTIVPKVDANFRDGYYFQNTVAGTKYNLYKFGGTAEIIKYSHVENIYAKLFIDGPEMPFFHIYTKPLGNGTDAQPWYNTKWTYTFNYPNFTSLGVESVLFAAVNKQTLDIPFNVQQYKHTDLTIDGPGTDGDILFMTIGSNSGATINTVQHCINLVGFKSDDGNVTITEKNFDLVVGNQQNALVYENATWGAGAFTDPFDLIGASKVRLYGNVGTNGTLQIQYASVLAGGVYDWQYTSITTPTVINGNICINLLIDSPPKYLRIENTSAVPQSVSFRVVKH